MTASATSAPARDYDAVLSLVASFGALVALGLLWAEENRGAVERPPAEAVATLTFTVADVRRRAEGTLVWDTVQTGAPLFERDSVFVPPGGSARIELGDDTVLELEESSLIVLEGLSDATTPAVQLVQGGVSGASGSQGLSIRGSAGTVQLSRESEARLSAEGGRGEVALYSGSATVRSGGSALELAGRQKSVLDKQGKLAATALGPELKLPSRNAKVYYQGVAKVALQWRADGNDPSIRLQLARDRQFRDLLPTPRTQPGEHVFTSSVGGVYWWRLVDASGRAASEARSFVLVEQKAPALTSPAWNEVLDYVSAGAIPFSWSAIPGATHYRVQISSTPDFNRPRIDQVVRGTQLRYQGPLSEGQYHWRVKAELPNGAHRSEQVEPPFSSASSFRLILKPLLEAPELIDSRVEVHPARK